MCTAQLKMIWMGAEFLFIYVIVSQVAGSTPLSSRPAALY